MSNMSAIRESFLSSLSVLYLGVCAMLPIESEVLNVPYSRWISCDAFGIGVLGAYIEGRLSVQLCV